MADPVIIIEGSKITELPDGAIPLGDELMELVQNGINVKLPLNIIRSNAASILLANYLFSSSIVSSDPGASYIRMNNGDRTLVTELYIDPVTGSPISDITLAIQQLRHGDVIRIQTQEDANVYVAFHIAGLAVNNIGWFTIPVEYVSHSGALFLNDEPLTVAFIYNTGGAGVNASETEKGVVEEATDDEMTAGTSTGETGAKLFVSPQKLQTLMAAMGLGSSQDFSWDPTLSYAMNEVVTYDNLWWQSLVNSNLNNVPGVDPTKWQEISKSESGLAYWQAGVYPQDEVFVLYPETGNTQLYTLDSPVRPYISTDFQAELDAGDWRIVSAGEGTDFGVTGRGYWRFSTSTLINPPTGIIRFNNSVMASVTQLYLNEVSVEGVNVQNFLQTVTKGYKFYIQQKEDSSRWMKVIVNGTLVDNGTWWTIPVFIEDDSGLLPQNNKDVVMRLTGTQGPDAQLLTEYFLADGVTTTFGLTSTEEIDIVAVFMGGQRMKEGVNYTKNNSLKTITTIGIVPAGITIDVEYLTGVTQITTFVNWNESTWGLARVATQIETDTGLEDLRAVTPLKLAQWFSNIGNKVLLTKSISNAASGSISHDCESRQQVMISYSNIVTGGITITRSNDSNLKVLSFIIPITGVNIPITFPSDVRMSRFNEVTSGDGWYQASKTLQVSSVGAGDLHEFSLVKYGSIYKLNYDGPARA